MTLRDRLMPAVSRIRGLRETLGVAGIVSIREETWSAAIGTAGAVATNIDTTLVPQPKVRKLSQQDAMFVMASLPASKRGIGSLNVYSVGPITKTFTTGGYTIEQLYASATASDSKRLLIMLAGDEFGAAPGTAFEIVYFDTSQPFRIMLTVVTAQVLA